MTVLPQHTPYMLIFLDAVGYFYELYYYGLGLPHLLDTVECTSNELHLSQCNYNIIDYHRYFFFSTIFAVKCQITGQSKLRDTVL